MNNPIWLVIFTSIIAIVPIVIGLFTSYVKVSVILGMLRSGIGAQQVPSGLVVMVLSLAMTAFIMEPVVTETVKIAGTFQKTDFSSMPTLERLKEYLPVLEPWQNFMEKHCGKREIETLKTLSSVANGSVAAEEKLRADNKDARTERHSMRVLMPAFVLSEIKEAFVMGFILLLPFLVIDLIVANVLAGMGMYMLSPVMISLPLKLIFFVMADGWLLLTKSIINSYNF